MKTDIRFDVIKPMVEETVGRRLDANETLFLQRQLESIEANLFKQKLKELKYRLHIPVSNRDNPGANTITYRLITMIGMARIIANGASDLPDASAFVQEFTAKVVSIAVKFGFSTQDLRAAAMTNMSLETIGSDAARRSVRERESGIAWNGDEQHNIQGFINHPNVPVVAAPAGAGGIPWVDKTADELIFDVGLGVTTVRDQSRGTQNADTLLLPIPQYNLIAQLPRSVNSDTTVLEFITKPGNAFGLKTVDWLPDELVNAFTGGTEDGAIFYEKDPEVLEQRIPLEMQILPVQIKGLNFEFPVEARNGGVVVRYPLGIMFLTGI